MTEQLAVILYRPGFSIDAFLVETAARLRARGLKLAGVVQHNGAGRDLGDGGPEGMSLEDLASGARIPISAARGPGATGCRLDAAGLAAASGAVAAALDERLDLVILNKFGRREAAGAGLRGEIAAVLAVGLPLLIGLRADALEAWRRFAGEDWLELAPGPEAIDAWLARRRAAR